MLLILTACLCPSAAQAKAGVSFSLRAASGYRGYQVPLHSLMYSGGQPLAGKSVDFAVDGVYAGTAVSGSTEVDLPWTVWSSLTPAAHDLTVSFAGDNDYDAGSRTAAALTVNAAANDTSVAAASAATGYPGLQVTLSSTLTSGGQPLAGKPVTFSVGGTAVGTGTTDANGVTASCTLPADIAAGTYDVTATFPGDADYNPSTTTGTGALTVLAPYLSDLTVTPTGGTGGSTSLTGTVTMNAPAKTGGQVVALRSNSSSLQVPSSVTVAQGETTAAFNATTSSVGDVTDVTVCASADTWTQAAMVTLLPSGYELVVESVVAIPGNGCAIVKWSKLPDGSVTGYNVYRRISGGNAVCLTQAPVADSTYPDAGLTNGDVADYQVSVVDLQGQEVSFSSWASATPSATYPTVDWVNAPSTVTGFTAIRLAVSGGTINSGGNLLVDGRAVGEVTYIEATSGVSAHYEAQIDSAYLTNGDHSFRVAMGGTSSAVTPAITVTTANAVSGASPEGMFASISGEAMVVANTFSSTSTSWTIDVKQDSNGATVRSWNGTGSAVNVAWDGTDSSGTAVDDDNYTIVTTAVSPETDSSTHAARVIVQDHLWKGLALMEPYNPYFWGAPGNSESGDYAHSVAIRSAFRAMHQRDSDWYGAVIMNSPGASITPGTKKHIRDLLGSSVYDLVIVSHGSAISATEPQCSYWAGIKLYPSLSGYPDLLRNEDADPDGIWDLQSLRKGRQYHFAMIDSCMSFGGATSGYPSWPVSYNWSNAFAISEWPCAALGWCGVAGTNISLGGVREWLVFRQAFWNSLGQGNPVSQALIDGITAEPIAWDFHTWDGGPYEGLPYRWQLVGDAILP